MVDKECCKNCCHNNGWFYMGCNDCIYGKREGTENNFYPKADIKEKEVKE